MPKPWCQRSSKITKQIFNISVIGELLLTFLSNLVNLIQYFGDAKLLDKFSIEGGRITSYT